MEVPFTKYTTLLALWSILDQALDLRRAFQEILRILSRELSAQQAAALSIDPHSAQACISVFHGLSPAEEQLVLSELSQYCIRQHGQAARPFLIRKTGSSLDIEAVSSSVTRKEISYFGVPILVDSLCAGLIMVDRLFPDNVPCSEDFDFLQEMAAIIARFITLNAAVTLGSKSLPQKKPPDLATSQGDAGTLSLVCSSEAMQHVWQNIQRVAPTRTTILLQGEPGVGKTRLARIIHQLSGRPRHEFATINCASIPDKPALSTRIACEKGPWSEAAVFEAVNVRGPHQGTLFLKDVSEVPLSIQAGMLEAIQELEHERHSGSSFSRAERRIIASTSRDLSAMCTSGLFRADFYYRLNVFPIQIPALRERRPDIPELLDHFLDRFSTSQGRRLHFSPRALKALIGYAWPGNVKEMKALLERLTITVEDDRIGLEQVQEHLHSSLSRKRGKESATSGGDERGQSLQETEKAEILAALQRNAWNQSKAAAELEISPRQMGYRVRKFNLKPVIVQGKQVLRQNDES